MAARKMSALYDAALAPAGVNVAQFSMLRHIARGQPVSLTELGRALELDRSTMGRNIRVVERLGLVETGRGEDDRREFVVRLSEQGAAVLREAEPLWAACQTEIAERVGSQRLGVLGEITRML